MEKLAAAALALLWPRPGAGPRRQRPQLWSVRM
jgi:hypothetical protein